MDLVDLVDLVDAFSRRGGASRAPNPRVDQYEEDAVLQPPDVADARLAAARKAVRGVGLALRVHRLYSAGHAKTQQGLLEAQEALRAYLTTYGSLGCAPAGRTVVFDFHPRSYEDDLVAELSRSLTSAKIGAVQFMAGVTIEEIAALVETLRLPITAIERAGGAGKMLRERGVQTIALQDLGVAPPGGRPATGIERLIETLRIAPDQLATRLHDASAGDVGETVQLLRALDRILVSWPRAEQEVGWRNLAAAIVATTPSLQVPLCRHIVAALHEPWAASIAARWPQNLIAGIVGTDAGQQSGGADDIITSLRALHRGPSAARVPPAVALSGEERDAARGTLAQPRGAVPPGYDLATLLHILAALDIARFEEGLKLIERYVVSAVEIRDLDTVVRVLTDLGVLIRLPDARADLARAALRWTLSTAARDLVGRNLAHVVDERHPLRQALAAVPEEAVPVLLELLADEARLHERRQLVTLLAVLARDQPALLGTHLTDPRWYVARNVVTALAEMGTPALVPYAKTALQHADLRVRKEAIAALGTLGTPEARATLTDVLRHPDAETRASAANWLNAGRAPDA